MRITDDVMIGDATPHSAHRVGITWILTWLPGRLLTRTQAITGMTIAETLAREEVHPGARMWPHVDQWAAELGLTGPEVVARVAHPPYGD